MNRLLSFIVLMFCSIASFAESCNYQEEIQSLKQKVDSLEHKLSYSEFSGELHTLKLDIDVNTLDVFTRYTLLKLDIINRNFDSRIKRTTQQYYEACLHNKESLSDLIPLYAVKIKINDYSESEKSYLMQSYNMIKSSYDKFEATLELLKVTMDIYASLL